MRKINAVERASLRKLIEEKGDETININGKKHKIVGLDNCTGDWTVFTKVEGKQGRMNPIQVLDKLSNKKDLKKNE